MHVWTYLDRRITARVIDLTSLDTLDGHFVILVISAVLKILEPEIKNIDDQLGLKELTQILYSR